MMNALNKNLIQKLIRNLHGNSLDDTAVERIANSITSIASTLEGAGFRASLDTQPADFDRALSELAGGGESGNGV